MDELEEESGLQAQRPPLLLSSGKALADPRPAAPQDALLQDASAALLQQVEGMRRKYTLEVRNQSKYLGTLVAYAV